MKQEYDILEYIDHSAVVVSVDNDKNQVVVTVSDNEDCHSCPAAKLCGIVDKDGKKSQQFTVTTPNASEFKKGEKVILRGTEQMHHRAIMLATVIPCIILLCVMFGVYFLTGSQSTAAFSGIGAMAFFFVLLYALRNRLQHEFVFKIKHS